MKDTPFVTIIMPIRNEADFILKNVSAFKEQDYEKKMFEVLIIDGMSTDETVNIIDDYSNKNSDLNLAVLRNPKMIFSSGFNIGLKKAKGDIIIMMGGHTVVAKDYISKCVYYLTNHNVDCVGGYIDTIAETQESKSIAIAMSSHFGVGGVGFRTKPNQLMEVDTVAFGAYTKKIIDKIGPVDEEMVKNQDDEYNSRLRKAGGRILLTPDIHSKYYSRATIKALWKQYYLYGFWKVRVLQKHPKQMKVRHFIPFALVFTVILSLILSLFFPFIIYVFMATVSLYAFANLLFSLLFIGKEKFSNIINLPIIYTILHFSYGVGFLAGLLKFALFKNK